MEYYEAVNRLERLRRLRPKLGTETTASLLSYLDDPHEDLRAVQIAGSNGKGSTAVLLARILREAGYVTGVYTSPDLNDLRDRITVNGQKIPKRDVVEFVETIWPHIVERSAMDDAPTFFEVYTALALWHFERADVDVAVLEVGIGGRYDATSVVDPVASAVTNVSLEHTDIIGSTIEEIARDKASVATDDAPLVTAATGTALDTIRERTDVYRVGPAGDPDLDVTATETGMVNRSEASVRIDGPDWTVETETSLLGEHQAVNAGIAAALAKQVGTVDETAIAAGIRNATWPGRFEIMGTDPFVVLDGAHNPDACRRLAALVDRYDIGDLHLVFGAMRDKDHDAMCRALPPADHAYVAAPATERAADVDVLAAVLERTTDATIEQYDAVLGALDAAMTAADPDDLVLVTGSLYTVGEARDRFTRHPTPVRTETASRARAVLRHADVPTPIREDLVDDFVTRTVRFHARRVDAGPLAEAMRAAGGTGAVSGIETADQHVDVVLSGTNTQFRRFIDEIERRPRHRHLAEQLRGLLEPAVDATYPWGSEPCVMGILNVTPDSFYDGGRFVDVDAAVERAEAMVADGAAIVDVGGESTRPGADAVPVAEEIERVVPVIERLRDVDALVSIDTRKPAVAEAALDAGADLVNDVTGLEDAAMRRLVAAHEVPVIVMHSLSAPVDPSRTYAWGDVVAEVLEELGERLLLAERAGIDRGNVIVDPGLGFGKAAAESFELLDRLEEFAALGTPVLVGHSRKSMFSSIAPAEIDRLAPTIAATALAVEHGADIIRVHDVEPNVAAVKTAAFDH